MLSFLRASLLVLGLCVVWAKDGCKKSTGGWLVCEGLVKFDSIDARTEYLHLNNTRTAIDKNGWARLKKMKELKITGSQSRISMESLLRAGDALERIYIWGVSELNSIYFLQSLSATKSVIGLDIQNITISYTFEEVLGKLNFIPLNITLIDGVRKIDITKDVSEGGVKTITKLKSFRLYHPDFACSKICKGLPNLIKAIKAKGFTHPSCLHHPRNSSNSSAPATPQWMKISRICPDLTSDCQLMGPARYSCNHINNFGQIGSRMGSGVELKVTNSRLLATPDNYDLTFLTMVIVEDSELGVEKYGECRGYPNLVALRLIRTPFSYRFLNECLIRPLYFEISQYPLPFTLDMIQLLKGKVVDPKTTFVIDQTKNPNLRLTRPSNLALEKMANISLRLTLSSCPKCRDPHFHWLMPLANRSKTADIKCKNGTGLIKLPYVTDENCTAPILTTTIQNIPGTTNYLFIVPEGCKALMTAWVLIVMMVYIVILVAACAAVGMRIWLVVVSTEKLRKIREASTRKMDDYKVGTKQTQGAKQPIESIEMIPRRKSARPVNAYKDYDDDDNVEKSEQNDEDTELYHF